MDGLDDRMAAKEDAATTALDLLDRVWSMHPAASPADVLSCGLSAQLRHLSQLPIGGGWMIRFLRDLPTSAIADAPIPGVPDLLLEDDVVCALALRCASHGGDGEAIYRDAAAICSAALTHMAPGAVCRIAIRSYRQARPEMMPPGDADELR